MVGTTGPTDPPLVPLINGQTDGVVDPFDRGLHYGDGLFETLAVRDGRPCLWRYHVERLQAGCRRLGLTPPEVGILYDEALAVTAGQPDAVLKIIVSRGPGARGYAPRDSASPTRWLACLPLPARVREWQRHGVRLIRCRTRLGTNPQLAGIKHLNRLEQVLAAAELASAGADEGLMCDADDHAVEGTCTNLYVLLGDRLVTPPLNRCGVEGVVRRVVLETAQTLGQPVDVVPIDFDELLGAERVFLSNSLAGIVEVARLDAREFPVGEALPAVLAAAQQQVFGS